MKRTFSILIGLSVVLLFASCGNGGNKHADKHSHAHTDECVHSHANEHAHHHDHEHDHEHQHDHEHHSAAEHSHSHDTHAHSHEHGEGIAFSRAQAEAAGLQVETVELAPFSGVIKAAGHIQTPVLGESVIVSTSTGVISYADPSLVEGKALGKGKAFASVSAHHLQEGDPLMKARLAYEAALAEYERASRLVDDKIVSEKEFEQIRLRYETAKATYEGQAQRVTSDGVLLVSPIGGWLKQLLVPNGSFVEVGQPVAIVAQTRRLQLCAEVSERDYSQLARVSTAHFRPAYADKLYKMDDLNGKLVAYGKTVSGDVSHYIPVTFEFDNIGDIMPGSYAEVYLLAESDEKVLSVPVSALTEEQGLYYVYVQLCDEEFAKRQVHKGRSNGERVEIVRGLHHGERVVTEGAYQVKLASVTTAIPHGHSH